MDHFSGRTWYAVVTHPGVEKYDLAKRELARQGYDVFFPLQRTQRINRGKPEPVISGLFGRYGMVGVAPGQPFHPINYTRGVAFVVRGMGREPTKVHQRVLEKIYERCACFEDMIIDRTPAKRVEMVLKWQADQPVRIVDSPFGDFIGIFRGARGDQVEVAMELFGRVTTVVCPAGALQAA